MANKSDQVSPRLNQVLVSSIDPITSSINPGDVTHLYTVKPISSNSLDLGLGLEAEFFDRSGNRISGKVVVPADESGNAVVNTLFTPSPKPVVQKVKQGLRVDRKVSARPRRERR